MTAETLVFPAAVLAGIVFAVFIAWKAYGEDRSDDR